MLERISKKSLEKETVEDALVCEDSEKCLHSVGPVATPLLEMRELSLEMTGHLQGCLV